MTGAYSSPERDDDGDVIEDRLIYAYQWHDPAYGIASPPAISVRVRYNPEHQTPEFVLHELTRAWFAICRSISDGGPHE